MTRTISGAESRAGAEEECPHEWGHGSLEGYATVLRRSAPQESSRRTKEGMDSSTSDARLTVRVSSDYCLAVCSAVRPPVVRDHQTSRSPMVTARATGPRIK